MASFYSWQNQRGAMFGMDARIALIIAAILTAVGGVTLMSKVERGKVDATQMALEGPGGLRDGLLKYYTVTGINSLPDTLEPLFTTGAVTDPGYHKDSWGNPWYYEKFSTSVKLDGTQVPIHFAVIFSAGKDGVPSSPGLISEADFAQWQPLGDDVGVKISTRDVELKRLEEYRARGQLIVDKLEAVESSNYLEAQVACDAATPPAWCENGGDSEFAGKNYTQFNFYPPSSMDTTDGTISYVREILNKPVYQSGSEADMQQLLLDIGLPPSYVKDPWGRIMQYNSNATQRTDPPFSASVCFSFGEDCFAIGQTQ